MKKKYIAILIILAILSLFYFYKYTDTESKEHKIHIKVFGTEYQFWDNARVWLQLLDDNNQPINNATCFVQIFYPDNTIFVNFSGMNFLGNGIFAYDFTAPNISGVYMVITKCTIPKLEYNITYVNITYDGFECGTINCGYGWSDYWYLSGRADITTLGGAYNGSYHLRLRANNGWAERPVNNLNDVVNPILFMWVKTYSFEANEYAYAYFWDGSWHLLRRWVDGEDDNVYKIYSFNLSGYSLGNNIIAFESDMSGLGDFFYVDDIKIQAGIKSYYIANETEYFIVRGSGELHISPRDTTEDVSINILS